MTDDFTAADISELLRDYALTDVKHIETPAKRSRVELAAAEEIDLLREVLRECVVHMCREGWETLFVHRSAWLKATEALARGKPKP